ncbi:hypothetical protein JB92DRAFT_2883286 [Gautieria morchelliformis]|nr:hypothetical protein JB92DRAFT_2883286 [Gautieria morchelliformis]
MSLEEPPLPLVAGAAQHAEPQPQLHSHPISLMSFAITDCCEKLASDSAFELDSNAHVVNTPDAMSEPLPQPEPELEPEPEADAQILEALRSPKDRLFVLKLGENMESLIQERHIRTRLDLTPASTYHKLLVHRCAAYYKLVPETESGSKVITIIIASDSRIPSRRVADLVPPDDSPLPAFKIMRRTPQHRTRSKTSSQTGSGNDDNALGTGDLSDGDPSEAGSSRGSRRKPLTMSERQALYEEARSRIFKDLEDKEKEKAQDMSASSSTLSLLSADSSSGGGGGDHSSSVGESLDETGSVDRDWISSGAKEKKGGLRQTGSAGSGSSRSLRSTAPPFNGHGHSPGFIYPTLYEPTPNTSTSSNSYDSSPSSGSSSHAPYQPTLYPVYQYGTPAYLAPFPYAYYPYPHLPPPHATPPDSSATSGDSPTSSPVDMYPPPVAFVNPYVWATPAPPPPPHHQGHPPAHNQLQPSHPTQGHPDFGQPQYQPTPVHPYTYPPPVPGYMPQLPPPVQSQPQPTQPQPNAQSQVQPQSHSYSHPPTRSQSLGPIHDGHTANMGMDHISGSSSQPQLYHPGMYEGPAVGGGSSVSRNVGGGAPGQKRMPTRSGWSYGPGVGGSPGGLAGEAMGPRMTTVRRTSGGNSISGGFTGSRTPGDETASTASSSTSSSSSRQTFTSTSSKHPLPARPDWAVGLKPQPTLHHSTSHHSSPRSHNGHLPSQAHIHHQRPPISMPLQSNDFPPLTVSPPNAEKRPTLGDILGPSLGRLNNGTGINLMNGHENGNGLLSSAGQQQQQNTRLDEHDEVFERPGPKAGGELFNPNAVPAAGGRVGAKSPTRKVQSPQEKERVEKDKDKASARGEAIANAILVDRVSALRIGQENGEQSNALMHGDGTSN